MTIVMVISGGRNAPPKVKVFLTCKLLLGGRPRYLLLTKTKICNWGKTEYVILDTGGCPFLLLGPFRIDKVMRSRSFRGG